MALYRVISAVFHPEKDEVLLNPGEDVALNEKDAQRLVRFGRLEVLPEKGGAKGKRAKGGKEAGEAALKGAASLPGSCAEAGEGDDRGSGVDDEADDAESDGGAEGA